MPTLDAVIFMHILDAAIFMRVLNAFDIEKMLYANLIDRFSLVCIYIHIYTWLGDLGASGQPVAQEGATGPTGDRDQVAFMCVASGLGKWSLSRYT